MTESVVKHNQNQINYPHRQSKYSFIIQKSTPSVIFSAQVFLLNVTETSNKKTYTIPYHQIIIRDICGGRGLLMIFSEQNIMSPNFKTIIPPIQHAF